MKKKGFSTAGIVAIVLIVAVLCVGTFLIISNNNKKTAMYEDYNSVAVIEANGDNGQIADHVRGNAEAPVIIQEYANFQCNHCAGMEAAVKQAVEAANGQVGFVFRNLTWASFQNSKAAAAAAEAAGLQGYWEPYASKLFEEQAEWGSASGNERQQLFDKYFEEVTNGQGDLEKFKADIASDMVAQKIDFDIELANLNNIEGTPAFIYEGQLINMNDGGDLVVDGQTIHYDAFNDTDGFNKLIQQILEVKNNAS